MTITLRMQPNGRDVDAHLGGQSWHARTGAITDRMIRDLDQEISDAGHKPTPGPSGEIRVSVSRIVVRA